MLTVDYRKPSSAQEITASKKVVGFPRRGAMYKQKLTTTRQQFTGAKRNSNKGQTGRYPNKSQTGSFSREGKIQTPLKQNCRKECGQMEIKMGVDCTMMIHFSGVWDAVILNDGEVQIGIEGAQDQLILQLIIHNTLDITEPSL